MLLSEDAGIPQLELIIKLMQDRQPVAKILLGFRSRTTEVSLLLSYAFTFAITFVRNPSNAALRPRKKKIVFYRGTDSDLETSN